MNTRLLVLSCAVMFFTPSVFPQRVAATNWETLYELSGCRQTPRLRETEQFCRRLAHASPFVHFTAFGTSPEGRRLPLLIVSSDRAFTPTQARKTGKAIILIQSGIHAGEIDGKDASLLLVRDLVIRHKYPHLLDHTILLFVPIFNVDGHERFGPFNRINQNGPDEMGWRTTAQNLNLNRDYMKADAPEMRAMLRLFNSWLPDLLVDCHVTDGIDFQYDVTYAVESSPNLDAGLSSWMMNRLLPIALDGLTSSGHKVFYYVFPREDRDLSRGLNAGTSMPRFSTGYATLQNRPAILIETHMLKPYQTRVEATYAFLVGIIQGAGASARDLHDAIRTADRRTVEAGSGEQRPVSPIRFGVGSHSTMKDFLGVEAVTESSDVSGGKKLRYTGRPVTIPVPFFDEVTVEDSVTIPRAYCVPQEWIKVLDVLRAHGIAGLTLNHAVTLTIEGSRFTEIRFSATPYEGRHGVTYRSHEFQEVRTLPAGTVVFPTAQRTGRVLMNLLEPNAPDALIGWGFFSTIFEQKEYAEPYVMERLADSILNRSDSLRGLYWNTVAADTSFARNPSARLNWVYQHSAWGDPYMDRYPVERIMEGKEFDKAWQATR